MKGLTLIETILYTALFSVIVTGSFGIAEFLFDSASRSADDARTEKIGSFILERLEYEINTGKPLAIPAYASAEISNVNIARTPQADGRERIDASFSIGRHDFSLHRIIP